MKNKILGLIFLPLCWMKCIPFHNRCLWIQGISWYGFETKNNVIEGLSRHTISHYLDVLQSHGFNSIRMPLSLNLVLYHTDRIPDQSLVSCEPGLVNKTSIDILDHMIQQIEERNMTYVLDMHRLIENHTYGLWYIENSTLFTTETLIEGLEWLIRRYKTSPAFFGLEVYNEPHLPATFGDNNTQTDFRLFLLECIHRIYDPQDDFYIMINGMVWGEDLSCYRDFMLHSDIGYMHERIIFTPHIYGPPINPLIPLNKFNDYYHKKFGYLEESNYIIINEWGNKYETEEEQIWFQCFVSYISQTNICNQYYWAMNPLSEDVGGLMDDGWDVMDEARVGYIKQICNHI